MKKITASVAALCLVLFLFSCSKKDKDKEPENLPEDVLDEPSEVVATQLDLEPSVYTDLNDVILPNGSKLIDFELTYNRDWLKANRDLLPDKYKAMVNGRQADDNPSGDPVYLGPQAVKNNIVAQMQIVARALVDKSTHTELLKNSELQKGQGLAYVYGSKDFTIKQKALDVRGKNNKIIEGCPQLLYGLDCSGMLSYLLKKGADLNVTGRAADLSLVSTWEKALKAKKDFEGIKVRNFTSKEIALNATQIRSGDIIYFAESAITPESHAGVTHIGIALQDADGKLMLYQSNGRQSTTCEKNYTSARGPRPIGLSDPIAIWKMKDYGVLRLEAEISGKWKAFIRCQDRTTDAITLELKFPVTEGGAFKANGSGTDYTGDPVNVDIDGNYDPKANKLTGKINYTFPESPSEQRVDKFEWSLEFDATPYFNLTKVVDNGGCSVAMRLLNLQSKEIDNGRQSGKLKSPAKTDCPKCAIGNY